MSRKTVIVKTVDGESIEVHGFKEPDPIRRAIGSYYEKEIEVYTNGPYLEIKKTRTDVDKFMGLPTRSPQVDVEVKRIPLSKVKEVVIEEDGKTTRYSYE